MMEPLISTDSDNAETEREQIYYNHFWESHFAPNGSQVDDTLLGVDTFSNVGVLIFNTLSNIIGMINMLFSLLLMALMSLYLNGTVSSVFEIVVNYLNDTILQWSNPTGTGIILVSFIGFLALLTKVIKMAKEQKTMKDILKTSLLYVIVIFAIPFSYTNLKPIEESISTAMTNVVLNEFGVETSYEAKIKSQVYDTMTFDGYILKNFGLSSIEDLANERDISYNEAQSLVLNLMTDDKMDDVLKSEYEYGNEYIAYDTGSALWQLFSTIIYTLHSVLMFIIIGIPTILMIIIKVFYEFFVAFIWIGLLMILINMKDNGIVAFLSNRLQWMVIYLMAIIIYNLFLQVIFSFTSLVSTYDITVIILFDMLLIFIYYLIYQNREIIYDIIKNVTSQAKDIMFNDVVSPKEMYTESKNIVANHQRQNAEIKEATLNAKKSSNSKKRVYEPQTTEDNLKDLNSNISDEPIERNEYISFDENEIETKSSGKSNIINEHTISEDFDVVERTTFSDDTELNEEMIVTDIYTTDDLEEDEG